MNLKELRKWAVDYIKKSFVILIIYGIWGLIFSYTYLRGGYPALAISMGIAIIYSINRGKN